MGAFSARFQELLEQLAKVEATKHRSHSEYTSGVYVDSAAYLNWLVKARNHLSRACGEESQHFKAFIENEQGYMSTNAEQLVLLKAVFSAAQEDYEGGHLYSTRSIVQSEVFDSELGQARELLASGYITAAAVIGGVVLEATLRELCERQGILPGKLSKMNADLSGAGVYNLQRQKRITALADIRNSAAHGNTQQFKADDVRDLIDWTENFIGDVL